MRLSIVLAGPQSEPVLNAAIGDFVSMQIWGEPGRVDRFSSMGVFDGPRLIAGVLFHNWHRDEAVMELSAASTSRRWLTRPVLKAMFAFPFEGCGCQMVVLRVSEQNAVMRRIARAYGFSEFTIPRLRGRDEAECILTLTDDGWRGNGFHKEY